MRVEEVIKGLNKHIEDKRCNKNIKTTGHLVLQKTITPHPTFKAYKKYKGIIWFVKGNRKYKVLSVEYNNNVSSAEREIAILLCQSIFNWIGSVFYEQVINGTYIGYEAAEHKYE